MFTLRLEEVQVVVTHLEMTFFSYIRKDNLTIFSEIKAIYHVAGTLIHTLSHFNM